MLNPGDLNIEAGQLQRRCLGCERPIPQQKLKAMPQARLCFPCLEESANLRSTPTAEPSAGVETCLRCGSATILRLNRSDDSCFIACTQFPTCWWTAPVN